MLLLTHFAQMDTIFNVYEAKTLSLSDLMPSQQTSQIPLKIRKKTSFSLIFGLKYVFEACNIYKIIGFGAKTKFPDGKTTITHVRGHIP